MWRHSSLCNIEMVLLMSTIGEENTLRHATYNTDLDIIESCFYLLSCSGSTCCRLKTKLTKVLFLVLILVLILTCRAGPQPNSPGSGLTQTPGLPGSWGGTRRKVVRLICFHSGSAASKGSNGSRAVAGECQEALLFVWKSLIFL